MLHVPDAKPGRCLQEGFVRDVQYLGEIGMSFDLCLRPSELGDAVSLVDQCPGTLFIVDHCGNADPQIVNGAAEHDPANPFSHTKEQWQRDIAALGAREHVVCKISGIIARAPAGVERRHAGTDGSITAWTALGRTEWCLVATGRCATLGRVWARGWLRCGRSSPGGSEEEQAKLLAGNAERLYGLE